MKRLNDYLEMDKMPSLEKDAIAQAHAVLGAIPEWYRKNKEVIEKIRSSEGAWSSQLWEDVKRGVENLNSP